MSGSTIDKKAALNTDTGGQRMKANIIAVFDKEKEKVLVCRRRKNPYKGLLNFVGGKIEKEEDGLTAAYRELWEETGITDASDGL